MAKKLCLFLCAFFSLFFYAQETNRTKLIEQTEKEIETYIAKHLATYEIPKKDLEIYRDNFKKEHADHHLDTDFETFLKEIKRNDLRNEYFKNNPDKKLIYNNTNATPFEILESFCYDLSDTANIPGFSVNTYTIPGNTPAANNSLNLDIGSLGLTALPTPFFSQVAGPVADNNVQGGTVTFANGPGILLNHPGANSMGLQQATVASFTITNVPANATLSYDSQFVLVNPQNHPALNTQPFFFVNILDANGVILQQPSSTLADPADCIYTNFNNGGIDPILYSQELCDGINLNAFENQTITIQFIVSDCTQGAALHFGYVYLSNICINEGSNGNGCSSLNGTINSGTLNAATSTINCPTDTLTLCGTYELPAQGSYNQISLSIEQNGTEINNIATPNQLDLVNQTFCFDIPVSAFGSNPTGDFNLVVQGIFNRNCGLNQNTPVVLNPIYDSEVIPGMPDVSFTDCTIAVDDTFTVNQCDDFSENILDNDYFFGAAVDDFIEATQVEITIVDNGGTPNFDINTNTGEITIPSTLPPGTYTIMYQICAIQNTSQCDTAVVEIILEPYELEAVDDDFYDIIFTNCDDNETPFVFKNDKICGELIIDPSVFDFEIIDDGGITGLGIGGNGEILIPSGVTPGFYVFTYEICHEDFVNQCSTADAELEIVDSVTPTFNFDTTICAYTIPPVLPGISTQGLTGTWNPSQINTTTSQNYTFTPNAACAEPVNIYITISQLCDIYLDWDSDVGCQRTGPRYDDDIEEATCIRVCENNEFTYTISGDINSIISTQWNISGGTITSQNNTSCTITWNDDNFGNINVIVTTNYGVKELNQCIEKVESPTALFGVYPDSQSNYVMSCYRSELIFENFSTANSGSNNLYYLWDFGDGEYSSAFEPTHMYDYPGSYHVTLTAYNGCNCADQYDITVIVQQAIPEIECPSVVCEFDKATYTLPQEFANQCYPQWNVEGGQIISQNPNHSEIEVLWNNVNAEGFGYINVSNNCTNCEQNIKVPVVKQNGTIQGLPKLCELSQGVYRMSQWPSTIYNWTLDDNGTGATIIPNNQRNEIVVQTSHYGTIQLKCNYNNTLLGCSGSANFIINVKPTVTFDGEEKVCVQSSSSYSLLDPNGNSLNNVSWFISGPNNFYTSGTNLPINVSFNNPGTYSFNIESDNYCLTDPYLVKAKPIPNMPDNIIGNDVVCPGIPEHYNVILPPDTSAMWMVENGTIMGSEIGNEIVVNFDPNATTDYFVKVAYIKEGCITSYFTQLINREEPDIQFTSGDQEPCGSSYEMYAVTPMDVEYYEWSIIPSTAGSVVNGQNKSFVHILWNQPIGGDINADVQLKIRKCGKDYYEQYPVTVMDGPTAIINAPDYICAGEPFEISVDIEDEGTFSSIVIDKGAGSLSPHTFYSPFTLTTNYLQPPSDPTVYTITATINNPNGCPLPIEVTKDITVYQHPNVLTFSGIDTATICNGNGPDYLLDYLDPTDTIQWYYMPVGGTSFSPTANTTNYIDFSDPANPPGQYYALVTGVGGCEAKTFTINAIEYCYENDNCPHGGLDLNYNVDACGEVTISIDGYTPYLYDPGNNQDPFEIEPYDYYLEYPSNLSPYVTDSSATAVTFSGLSAGHFDFTGTIRFIVQGETCANEIEASFIVPYTPNFDYEFGCAGAGYGVTIFDESSVEDTYSIDTYEFTVDGGNTWEAGNVAGEPGQFTSEYLIPGTHSIGIKIDHDDYPECILIEDIVVPAPPTADFTYEMSCENTATQFTALDTAPGLSYLWNVDFGDSYNILQNPEFTLSADLHTVILEVTDQYGCTFSSMNSEVTAIAADLMGVLEATPEYACEDDNKIISFTPNTGNNMPNYFEWYKDEETPFPYATTTTPELTVTENGLYFTYVMNNDGCIEYTNPPISIAFTKLPNAPVITGSSTVCYNSEVSLSVIESDNLHYTWYIDGVLQPQWDGNTEITHTPTQAGIYTYQVSAAYNYDNGVTCTGPLGERKIIVLSPLVTPTLDFTVEECSPYIVNVFVTNPQTGVLYTWSNGTVGQSTTLYHDGPVEVRAEINGCSKSNQIDLPVDLESLAWIFPDGCYSGCRDALGYMVGPLGVFPKWAWLANDGNAGNGAGEIADFQNLNSGNYYELFIDNGYCASTYSTMDYHEYGCKACEIHFQITGITCAQFNGEVVYQITWNIVNTSGSVMPVNITSQNNGYIGNGNHTLNLGNNYGSCYFFPETGFNGGAVTLNVLGEFAQEDCMSYNTITLPQCEGLRPMLNPTKDNAPFLILAPNPADHETKAYFDTTDKYKDSTVYLELRDVNGRLLQNYQSKNTKDTVTLNCSELPAGTYFVILIQNGKQIAKSQLIVK